MAYIGQGIKNGTFAKLDTSGNTYNGSNVTFALGTQVGSPVQLLVSHDGVIQNPGTDYTLASNGTQITFTTAPASGASIFIMEISGAVGGPMNRDLNGEELILDVDGDTSITADTDDQIDIKIAGADDFNFTANTFTAASGSTIAAQALTATTLTATGATSLNGGAFVFNEDSADVDFRIESNGNANMLFVDGGNNRAILGSATSVAPMALEGALQITGNSVNAMSLNRFTADEGGFDLIFLSSRNATPGSTTIVQDNDELGALHFCADDGTDYASKGAKISAKVNGTPGANDTPAELIFETAYDGANSTVNNMSISSEGNVGISDRHTTDSSSAENVLKLVNNADKHIIFANANNTSMTNSVTVFRCNRSGSQFYELNSMFSNAGGSADKEFRVDGDGDVHCDGSFSGSGADYAEYFQTKDGNSIAVGKTVVLDGDKVRASTDSDNASDILGIVRPGGNGQMQRTSVVIGNAQSMQWHGKYLIDDYDAYVLEEYTTTTWYTKGKNADGEWVEGEFYHSYETDKIPADGTEIWGAKLPPDNAVVSTTEKDGVTKLKRKKLNPSYDESKTYVPREDRDEWVLIGLLGQVPMTKGEKTGSGWTKMKDRSGSVELWYIK